MKATLRFAFDHPMVVVAGFIVLMALPLILEVVDMVSRLYTFPR